MHSYLVSCSVGVLSVVLRHKARIIEKTNLQGFCIWSDLTSNDIPHLIVPATVFQRAQLSTLKLLCNAHLKL